ncbi:MAG: MarR family transcriptional regulator [Euzebyales bacterium]|nr:MarR family transcriptional regulator [Euzebyales bacterium]
MDRTTGVLLVRAAKAHRTVVAQHLAPVGLHVGQDLLLLELSRAEGMSQRQLADRLGVEQPTVGIALRRLEAAGFVQRRPAPDDARVRLVALTEQGRQTLQTIHSAWTAAEGLLTDRLTAKELGQLRRLLTAVTQSGPAPSGT